MILDIVWLFLILDEVVRFEIDWPRFLYHILGINNRLLRDGRGKYLEKASSVEQDES